MLIEFSVKNFRSFRDRQSLSMVASADRVLMDNTASGEVLGKQRLLRSAVVYGANASGKTNLFIALDTLRQLILRSTQPDWARFVSLKPFLFDQVSATAPSEFEITFVHEKVRYQYGLVIDVQRVHSEWLVAYPKGSPQTWFERTTTDDGQEYEWHFGPRLLGEKARIASLTRPDVLFLSMAATLNHRQLTRVYSWFVRNIDMVFVGSDGRWIKKNTPDVLGRSDEARHAPDFRPAIAKLLRQADIGIVDIIVQERARSEEELPPGTPESLRSFFTESAGPAIFLQHEAAMLPGHAIRLSMDEESEGTRRLFILGGLVLQALKDGHVLVVDELDEHLHPLLVRALVGMFHNPQVNKSNAQLIFNTHDTTLLDTEIFRRDQIWFVEKDRDGASHLYPLLKYKPRKEEALERGYLHGRYGAVPLVDQLLTPEAVGAEVEN